MNIESSNNETTSREMMQVARYLRYGSPEVFEISELEKPSPADNEVLIQIHATTVTATEATFRKGQPFVARLFTGLTKPKLTVLGEELSGEIVAMGSEVTRFKVGDQVFGTAGPEFGANAEYLIAPEDGVLTLKPANLSHEEAAGSVDGFLTSMPFLRDTGGIIAGQKVLIYGASGSVGAAAVQIARHFDTTVTAVTSTGNVDWVKDLGAHHVIDYKHEDFTSNGETYDIIFDAVGKISYGDSKPSLTSTGVFLEAGFSMSFLSQSLLSMFGSGKKAKTAATGLRKPEERRQDLEILKELLVSGEIKPVIDKSFTLKALSEAHEYVDQGHKKGNVVINMEGAV